MGLQRELIDRSMKVRIVTSAEPRAAVEVAEDAGRLKFAVEITKRPGAFIKRPESFGPLLQGNTGHMRSSRDDPMAEANPGDLLTGGIICCPTLQRLLFENPWGLVAECDPAGEEIGIASRISKIVSRDGNA